jgi:hypothetical protein
MSKELIVIPSPTQDLSVTNNIYINSDIFNVTKIQFLKIKNYIFSVREHPDIKINEIALNLNIRKITVAFFVINCAILYYFVYNYSVYKIIQNSTIYNKKSYRLNWKILIPCK